MENIENKEPQITNETEPVEAQVEGAVSAVETSGKTKDYFLPISILVAAVLISGSIIYAVGSSNRPGAKQQANLANATASIPAVGGRDVVLGDSNAPVTFIEYGDYQCPFCHQFFNQFEPQIRDQYVKTGKVKMVYRNFMVVDELAHDTESHLAAMAGECAKDQGKFWEFHDAVIVAETKDGKEANGNMTRDFFMQAASTAKLDTNSFAQCYDSKKYAQTVQDEMNAATKAGVQGTPSFFVNGAQVQDPLQAISQALGNS